MSKDRSEKKPKPETSSNEQTPKVSKKRRKAAKRWRFGWRVALFSFLFPVLLVPLVIVAVTYMHFAQDLPSIESLKNYRPNTVSFVFSDDGRVIGEYATEHRLVVPLEKVPRHVILAFVAAEDANFFNHPGVDLLGIARAFYVNYMAGRIVQGGSTITQQVTRSFLLSNEKTYKRKIKEALLAWRIEQNLTKEEILFLYLNQIYLGRGAYGVQSASKIYFGKDVSDLTLAEAALIAGLIKAPGRYSPFRTPDVARSRQIYVLNRMVRAGFVTFDAAQYAQNQALVFAPKRDINQEITPYFTEHVRRLAGEIVGWDALYTQGLRIYTTVNIEAQAQARKSIKAGLEEHTRRHGYKGPRNHLDKSEWEGFFKKQDLWLASRPLEDGHDTLALVTEVLAKQKQLKIRVGSKTGIIESKELAWAIRWKSISSIFNPGDVILVRYVKETEQDKEKEKNKGKEKDKKREPYFELVPEPDAQSALICMDTATGDVKAAVGGRDFRESQFHRAIQARRQPGSSFKPFVYTAAMDSGFTQASVINDIPVEYDDMGTVWSPKNYGGDHHGPMTLYSALVASVNVIAVRLSEKVGPQRVVDYAHKMGIESELGPYLSLALGSCEVTLLEMVRAYSTFPNLGEYVEPRFITRIEDRDGKVIASFNPKRVRAIEPDTAYVVLDMLRGVVLMGTGHRVSALGRPVAGKTGTTNDQADAWFIGFTPDTVTGVWVGRDIRSSLGSGEAGGRTAAPIFLSYMKEFVKDKPVKDFEMPTSVVRTLVSQGFDEEDGQLRERRLYLVFKKGQVGPGRSEEPEYPEEEGLSGEPEEAIESVRERMDRYLQEYRSNGGNAAPVQHSGG
jgi:penicillin-binding protein 1A